jgi:hypothetical protein
MVPAFVVCSAVQSIMSAMLPSMGGAGSDGGSGGDQQLADFMPNSVLQLNGVDSNQTTASSSVGRQQMQVGNSP